MEWEQIVAWLSLAQAKAAVPQFQRRKGKFLVTRLGSCSECTGLECYSFHNRNETRSIVYLLSSHLRTAILE
jgi:hypothetical protein